MGSTPSFDRTCPRCHASVPVYDHFRSWCDRCEWNLEEDEMVDPPGGLFNRIWSWANRRFGERQFNQAIKHVSLRPKFSFNALLAILISVVVHLITIALVVTFFGLVYQGVIDVLNAQIPLVYLYKFFLAILLFFVVRKIRPRLGKLPKEALRRADAPLLFTILDRVSAVVGARRVQAVILDPEFNAGVQSVGLRQELTLVLGLPLLFSLDRYELVALLSHELAHDVKGESIQLLLVENAVDSLSKWFDLFFFDRMLLPESPSLVAVFLLILQIVVWILSSVFWLLTALLSLLLYPLKQRAEYRADGMAVVVAGQKAAERLRYKLCLRDAYHTLLKRAAEFPNETRVFETILQFFADPPEREFERIRRVIAKGRLPIAPTHPSPRQRLEFLHSRPPSVGQVVLSDAEFKGLIGELTPYASQIDAWIKQALTA